MTKEELWKVYCDKNPSFADESAQITMTARGLKKLFDQTWDQAVAQTKKSDMHVHDMISKLFPK